MFTSTLSTVLDAVESTLTEIGLSSSSSQPDVSLDGSSTLFVMSKSEDFCNNLSMELSDFNTSLALPTVLGFSGSGVGSFSTGFSAGFSSQS